MFNPNSCEQVTRAYIHTLMAHKEASGCALLTVHNVAFQLRLMKSIRQAIKDDKWVSSLEAFDIISTTCDCPLRDLCNGAPSAVE